MCCFAGTVVLFTLAPCISHLVRHGANQCVKSVQISHTVSLPACSGVKGLKFSVVTPSLKGEPCSIEEVESMSSSVAELQSKWTSYPQQELPNMNAEFAPQFWEFMSRLKPGGIQQAPLGLTDFMERKATRNESDLFPEPSATQRMRKLFPTFADM